MKATILSVCIVFGLLSACQSQDQTRDKVVGGPCQGCEALHEYGDKLLSSSDTLPDFATNEPKLKITGRVLQKDGKTPANNVIIYIYHTDKKGIYPKKGGESGWANRHGYIRGWIKTAADGKYTFYTFRPGAYPGRQVAEHIHITIKEQGFLEYYIDDFLFEDDPILTDRERNRRPNRGGSGIFTPELKNGIMTIERDIILGLNIPDYN